MEEDKIILAQNLLQAFHRFRKLECDESPISGLKASEISVLFCIKKAVKPGQEGLKVSEISRFLRVASPTVTQLVNGLEAHGLIERKMDKEDRRAVRITLTQSGESVIKKATEVFLSSYVGLVEYLGKEESEELIELLSKVFNYFNESKKINFNDRR